MKLIALIILLLGPVAQACTAFCIKGSNVVFGNNLDWDFGHGVFTVNKRGVAKVSLITNPLQGFPKLWVSKYGSITFNQVAREFPYGGMNEMGLAVTPLVLRDSKYPNERSLKPNINESQWIQHALDSYATVSELKEGAKNLVVQPAVAGGWHYFACDAGGACAVFEYLNRKLLITDVTYLPLITNDTHENSANHLREFQNFGGDQPIPADQSSLSRFVRAAAGMKRVGEYPIAAAFDILGSVRQNQTTQTVVSLVLDLTAGRVYYTSRQNPLRRWFEFREFSFDNKNVEYLDVNASGSGEVRAQFQPFMKRVNEDLLAQASFIPGFARFALRNYYRSTFCLNWLGLSRDFYR